LTNKILYYSLGVDSHLKARRRLGETPVEASPLYVNFWFCLLTKASQCWARLRSRGIHLWCSYCETGSGGEQLFSSEEKYKFSKKNMNCEIA
jgi:hypothetical protein